MSTNERSRNRTSAPRDVVDPSRLLIDFDYHQLSAISSRSSIEYESRLEDGGVLPSKMEGAERRSPSSVISAPL
jgi:hypothetical protein